MRLRLVAGAGAMSLYAKLRRANNLSVTIAEIEPLGDLVRVRGDDHHGHLLAADVTPLSVAELDLYPGREVTYSIKAAGVTIYPL